MARIAQKIPGESFRTTLENKNFPLKNCPPPKYPLHSPPFVPLGCTRPMLGGASSAADRVSVWVLCYHGAWAVHKAFHVAVDRPQVVYSG